MFNFFKKKEYDLNLEIENLNVKIHNYVKKCNDLEEDNRKLKERVIELENGIEKNYSVSIRKEVKNVNTDLNRGEFSIILSGICKLINDSGNIDDIKVYIEIYEKINKFISDVPDKGKE